MTFASCAPMASSRSRRSSSERSAFSSCVSTRLPTWSISQVAIVAAVTPTSATPPTMRPTATIRPTRVTG
ncbi:hypothetical protein [Pseudolysinimonas kribbensis]|uniref:hypothetical protein n=1 Tax=Pseudolysinimonas kribbensis TaxID=433641 RepID=UPI0024E0F1D0|nr:hypothetical protein [Pseudolysinimonas kribbensis]